jgi:hypothetical protein
MSNKLTFKQYLESKEQLKAAVQRIPQQVVEYSVKKYCKIVVGENKDDRQYINLKPKHKVLIEWLYDDMKTPTPISIRFEGVKDVEENNEYKTSWANSKLAKWLLRNAKEV